jgi:hypothetical protein
MAELGLVENLRGYAAALRSEADLDRDMGHDGAAKLRDMRADEISEAADALEAQLYEAKDLIEKYAGDGK